jgi:hypothetical protein
MRSNTFKWKTTIFIIHYHNLSASQKIDSKLLQIGKEGLRLSVFLGIFLSNWRSSEKDFRSTGLKDQQCMKRT